MIIIQYSNHLTHIYFHSKSFISFQVLPISLRPFYVTHQQHVEDSILLDMFNCKIQYSHMPVQTPYVLPTLTISPQYIDLLNRLPIDMLASTQLVHNNLVVPTNNQDKMTNNKHITHIHTIRQVSYDLPHFEDTIFAALRIIYPRLFRLFTFQIRLNLFILCVEIGHIDDKVFEDHHMP